MKKILPWLILILVIFLGVSALFYNTENTHSLASVNRFILAVGISDGDPWAKNDVVGMAGLLRASENNNQVFVSTDSVSCAKSNLKRVIADYASAAVGGDIVYLYFSCHGTQVSDTNKDERNFDPLDTMDEAMKLYNNELLVDDEMDTLFRTFKKGVQIVFIADCCHSGSLATFEKYAVYDFAPSSVYADMKAQLIYMGACQDNKDSETSTGKEYSVFTQALIDQKKKYPNKNYQSLFSAARARVDFSQTASYMELTSRGLCSLKRSSACQLVDTDFRNQIAFSK